MAPSRAVSVLDRPITAQKGPQMVGDVDPSQGGFHLGQAQAGARPISSAAVSVARAIPSPAVAAPRNTSQTRQKTSQGNRPPSRQRTASRQQPPGGAQTFEDFKRGAGHEYNEVYTQNRSEFRIKRKQLKDLTQSVNRLTKQIKQCENELQLKRVRRLQQDQMRPSLPNIGEEVEVLDEEEFRLIQECKELKNQYTTLFDNRSVVLDQVAYLKDLVDHSKMQLANAYMKSQQSFAPAMPQPVRQKAKEADEEALDEAEQFEQLEKNRIMMQHPDSLSFYNARKTVKGLQRKKRMQGSRKPASNQRPRMRV